MKWYPKPERKLGTQRVRRIFALLPKQLDDGRYAWLERVYLLQEWNKYKFHSFELGPVIVVGWIDKKFSTKKITLENDNEICQS